MTRNVVRDFASCYNLVACPNAECVDRILPELVDRILTWIAADPNR